MSRKILGRSKGWAFVKEWEGGNLRVKLWHLHSEVDKTDVESQGVSHLVTQMGVAPAATSCFQRAGPVCWTLFETILGTAHNNVPSY